MEADPDEGQEAAQGPQDQRVQLQAPPGQQPPVIAQPPGLVGAK